jgi:HK97 gp10 family phage protein
MGKQTFSTNGMEFEFEDNSGEILKALENARDRGLEAIGEKAVEHARNKLKEQGAVDTTNLLQNVDYKVDGDDVYVGTDNDHGIYVEMGTGKYYAGGRRGFWVYVPGSSGSHSSNPKTYTLEEAKQVMAILQSRGIDAHITDGMKARPFIKPAASEHTAEYRKLLEESMKNA